MKIDEVLFFSNGNTAIFTDGQQQISELQVPWFLEYLKYLEFKGVSPKGVKFYFPCGTAEVFKNSDDTWNWKFLATKTKDRR